MVEARAGPTLATISKEVPTTTKCFTSTILREDKRELFRQVFALLQDEESVCIGVGKI